MSIAFPNESKEYREARDRLLQKEIALRGDMEAVAAARRALPPGGEIPEDYVFQERGADGSPTRLRMSELFAPGKDSLAIYTFMPGCWASRSCSGPRRPCSRTPPTRARSSCT